MAPKKKPWFRFYVEALDDPKLRRMKPEHRWLWMAVLGAARQSPISGFLMLSVREPLTEADLADKANIPERSVGEGLAAMQRAEMIEWDDNLGCWQVINWTTRQFESDKSTERVRNHRSKSSEVTAMERPIGVDVTPSESESKSETDSLSSSVLPVGVEAVLDAVADRRLNAAQTAGQVRSPQAWRARVRANLAGEIGAEVASLLAAWDEPPHVIAEVVEGARNKQYLKRRPVTA